MLLPKEGEGEGPEREEKRYWDLLSSLATRVNSACAAGAGRRLDGGGEEVVWEAKEEEEGDTREEMRRWRAEERDERRRRDLEEGWRELETEL